MLLWKSWRDLRIFVFVGLGWLALLSVVVVSHGPVVEGALQTSQAGSRDLIAGIVGAFIQLQTFAFAFLVWGMGTRGIGGEIGRGAGSFELTRPVRRASFVWAEWLAGITAVMLLMTVDDLLYWTAVRLHVLKIVFFQPSTANRWTLVVTRLPFGTAAIATLCAFLFLALIFSLTYFGTVALRNSTRGLLFSLGIVIAYLWIGWEIYLHTPSWAPHYPDLLLQPFYQFPENMRLIPHVTSSILERLAILPLFPLLAQLFLRRTEV
jgi:hypothetical protein